MKLKCVKIDLALREAFSVSSNSRTHTESIFVELDRHGMKGYGQASFPPYLAEKREDNFRFLNGECVPRLSELDSLENAFEWFDTLAEQFLPAKAAVDIALHDLAGKIAGKPLHQWLGISWDKKIHSSITIGIGDDEFIARKVREADAFKLIKVKLGKDVVYNLHAIRLIKSLTAKAVGVDFNGGLTNKEMALDHISQLKELNILYVEQPFPATMEAEMLWLKPQSPLEIYGDESFQNEADLTRRHELFHGVNIKLMKCGGIRPALKMAELARKYNLKTMLGCMTESACAVAAAAHLAPLFDRIDLDGDLLIANDPFKGIHFENGQLMKPELPGLGVQLIHTELFN